MKECFLTPIQVIKPPRHTQIVPRCKTCAKAQVCNLRSDYLKTAYLIQQILGDPQEDRELSCECDFKGFELDNALLPEQINAVPASGDAIEGILLEAKYKNENLIQAKYNFDGYQVIFTISWNEETNHYVFGEGKELYYDVIFTLETEDFDDTLLLEWREKIIQEREQESEDKDVINTTHFSVTLNCDFYEFNKCMNKRVGWEEREHHHKHKDGYHHLATFHVESQEIPELSSSSAPDTLIYPVFIPTKEEKPKRMSYRRDDINE